MYKKNQVETFIEVMTLAEFSPLIFDTETTGLDETAELCDIAIVEMDGTVVFDSLVKTVNPISAGAESVHHISNEMIANAPTIDRIIPQLNQVIRGRYLLAYNAEYDFRLLFQTIAAAHPKKYPMLEFAGVLDLMKPAARYYGEYNEKYGSYKYKKLGEIAAYLGIKVDDALHRARADALVTAEVLRVLCGLAAEYSQFGGVADEPALGMAPAGSLPEIVTVPEKIAALANSFAHTPTRQEFEYLAAFIRSLTA